MRAWFSRLCYHKCIYACVALEGLIFLEIISKRCSRKVRYHKNSKACLGTTGMNRLKHNQTKDA